MTATGLEHVERLEPFDHPQDFGPWPKRQPPSAAIRFSGRFEKPHYQTTSGILRLEARQENSESYARHRNSCILTAFRCQVRSLVTKIKKSSGRQQFPGRAILPGGFERGRRGSRADDSFCVLTRIHLAMRQ